MFSRTSSALSAAQSGMLSHGDAIHDFVTVRQHDGRPALFAKTAIPSGCQIFLERPVLVIGYYDDDPHGSLLKSFNELSDEDKNVVYKLPRKRLRDIAPVRLQNEPGQAERFEIFDANAISTGLFTGAGMMRHSCVPNVHTEWNDHLEQQASHAIRDIAAGEELCMSKFKDGLTLMESKADRQSALLQQRGIECQCSACTDSEENREDESERLREQWRMYASAQKSNDAKIKISRANFRSRYGKSEDHEISSTRLKSISECAVQQVVVQEKLGLYDMDLLGA